MGLTQRWEENRLTSKCAPPIAHMPPHTLETHDNEELKNLSGGAPVIQEDRLGQSEALSQNPNNKMTFVFWYLEPVIFLPP